MNFAAAIEALTGRRVGAGPVNVALEPDAHLARIERDLDRTSEAFNDALNLLERSLPLSFGA